MKKLLCMLSILLCMCNFLSSETKTKTETIKINDDLTLISVYSQEHSDIRVILVYSKSIDEGDLETTYQKYIQKWISNPEHFYYSYKTVHRKRFFKKRINDHYYKTFEFYTVLYK